MFLLLIFVVIWLLFWRFVFLRNPTRKTAAKSNELVSPADGKIIAVEPFTQNKINILKGNKRTHGLIRTITQDVAKEGYIISIYMSPLNVHYNRSPITGSIISVTHQAGRFFPARSFIDCLQNEKTEILIANNDLKIKVIQIAGFLARRIETYTKPTDLVKKGAVIGRINLGSQVTVIIPKCVTPSVKISQNVKAGETIIGKIDS